MISDRLQVGLEEADMVDGSGELGKALLPGSIMIPAHVEVQGDMLAWYADEEWNGVTWPTVPQYVRAEGPILDQFFRLSVNSPESIARFARRWGVFDRPEDRNPWRGGPTPYEGKEPLAMWAGRVAQVRAILQIAAQLHQGNQTSLEDWQVALSRGVLGPGAGTTLATRRTYGRFLGPWTDKDVLASIVNGWLDGASVRPRLTWDVNRPPKITLQGRGLAGGLAVQLMAAVGKADGVTLCTGCGLPYTPERRPRAGERNYCPVCREAKIPRRDVARELRRRRKTQGAL